MQLVCVWCYSIVRITQLAHPRCTAAIPCFGQLIHSTRIARIVHLQFDLAYAIRASVRPTASQALLGTDCTQNHIISAVLSNAPNYSPGGTLFACTPPSQLLLPLISCESGELRHDTRLVCNNAPEVQNNKAPLELCSAICSDDGGGGDVSSLFYGKLHGKLQRRSAIEYRRDCRFVCAAGNGVEQCHSRRMSTALPRASTRNSFVTST